MRRLRLVSAVVVMGLLGGAQTASASVVSEFAIPTPASNPTRIAAGPDGALWFTEKAANAIGRITPSGNVTTFSLAGLGPDQAPFGITSGPGGLMYFTESAVGKVASINPLATNVLASLNQSAVVPSGSGAGLRDITSGADGNLWFTEASATRVANINPALTTITEYPGGISPGSQPVGITSGPDRNLWFAEASAGKIGRITTAGAVTEFDVPSSGSSPTGIAVGADGALWFTEASANKIGRITTSGAVTEPVGLAPGSSPTEITGGPDGALWFTEAGTDRIGRVTTAGRLSEFSIPTGSSAPTGIAAGPDGALWFTEANADQIGRVTIPDPGNQGPQGPPGPQGAAGKLVLVAFKARVRRRAVTVSYAVTDNVAITLSVKRARGGRAAVVARGRGRAGLDRIQWNRKLHGKPAAAGRYTLIVTATRDQRQVSSRLEVVLG